MQASIRAARSPGYFLWLTLAVVAPMMSAAVACGQQAAGQDNIKELERQLSLLSKPAHIRVDIIRRELELNEDRISERYREGDEIYFRIQLTNTSISPALVLVSDPYFQNRPQLLRDGQEVAYRQEVAELVEAKDKEHFFRRNYFLHLESHAAKVAGHLWLKDWYGRLKPGSYRLINKHRFVPRGEWLESRPITFEVEPE